MSKRRKGLTRFCRPLSSSHETGRHNAVDGCVRAWTREFCPAALGIPGTCGFPEKGEGETLERDVDPIFLQIDGTTALILSSENGHQDCLSELLCAKADVGLCDAVCVSTATLFC